MSLCGSSESSAFSCSLHLVNLSQTLEWTLFHNPLKAVVIPVLCAFCYYTSFFHSTSHYLFWLGYSTLSAASFLPITFSGLPSLWKVSGTICWTTVKLAVFPMIIWFYVLFQFSKILILGIVCIHG
ncbi:hypothetical protein ATANTOWER_031422 [Ataeniobius toweri]|uniref:Uncharacterized protein n=1 Tax=Ataeniobius toweri TaxID=208326 RepID=A0ABU7BE06_9TELE|nr:hypothetical protein [Ataeniobius toweri]